MKRIIICRNNILIYSLVLTLMLGVCKPVYAFEDDSNYNNLEYAQKLSEIGVFVGTDHGYELYREPTRLEALVVLIRLLGVEEEAFNTIGDECPFNDVPDWGKSYVTYAYNQGLTKGLDDATFGADCLVKSNSFMTFMLRALGYNDAQGDFSWENANEFARAITIIDEPMYITLEEDAFIRNHVAKIVYDTLQTNVKDIEESLAATLVTKDVFDYTTAIKIEVIHDPNHSKKEMIAVRDESVDTIHIKYSDAEDINSTDDIVIVEEVSLLGDATASMETVTLWALSKGMNQEGIDLIPVYYDICSEKGLNPVIQYIQMCIETGWLYKVSSQAGLDATYHNPCGLKIAEGGDNFDAHAHFKFDSWYDGIDAHTDHTALYAGLPGYPKEDTKDPRHFSWLHGKGDTVELMARSWVGKTAENDDGVYADKILKLYNEILKLEQQH